MMIIKDIFSKPVDRPIEGVIKADDEASLRLEIEEYVLTNEVEKRLESFLEAYNNYENANGVWISGFFGSGKSHLLKMLALVLEKRQIDGVSALDLFLPKCGDNSILQGDLLGATAIPSKSILFNIDQKADVISKTQIDALLAVFVKVFDEMCGYYGKQGHIARFERDLDSRGLYEQFKAAYESASGRPWEKGREQALLEGENIAAAYARVTKGDPAQAMGILDRYRKDYRVSIEDFAEEIHAYIERQVPGFRLNFFVDEVGQYIAGNIKLMTNLQTIAESLATKCRGRAWIIVTAQEDMTTVVGEMSMQQGNDFSKIQARFANRMKLTSADVEQVIRMRLLAKTRESARLLETLYDEQANNFKTLFDFADGSMTYRNFRDRDHFIDGYPFIPYQFALFQSAIQSLSQHNAFEGKHSSVGERSMLGVFQQVAIRIADRETGCLATFDLMCEGIRTALKANIQRAVIQAENHLDSPFAICLLKALFLVKYVKEFKPTVRNLSVLMLDGFNRDLPAHRKRVQEALDLLEQQTYIRRSGEFYEYLTDEEKDVEQEIKNTEVESSDVAAELEKLVFEHVLRQNKIRYDKNGQDYPFSRKLDDHLYGREYELSINVISPFHEYADNEQTIRLMSSVKDELMVLMPPDERLIRDLLTYKRTDKYIRQVMSITQQETVKRILTDKGFQNRERYAELQQRVQTLMGKAALIVKAGDIETASEDGQTRIVRGFHELISRTYPNLRMLGDIALTENDIAKCLDPSRTLFNGETVSLDEAEQEMLASIQNNSRGGTRTTVKTLLETFGRKPYGWYYAAVLCSLANLCALGKVEVRSDSTPVEDDDLERALRNTHLHGSLILEPQIDFTAAQVRSLKDFFGDFFDSPPQAGEAKALGRETGGAFQELRQQLAPLAASVDQYPFLGALAPVQEKLRELSGKPYDWYLTALNGRKEELLDLKERVIDPIRKFMSGPQKEIFDNARVFLQEQEANFSYIEGDEAPQSAACLKEPECYRGGRMQTLKTRIETLGQKISARLEAEISGAENRVAGLKERLCAMDEFIDLTGEQQEKVTRAFADFASDLRRQKLIAVIRDSLRRFEEKDYHDLLSRVITWAKPPAPEKAPDRTATPGGGTTAVPAVEFMSSRAVKVDFDKPWLANEADVDRYLQSMREALLGEIRRGKKIRI